MQKISIKGENRKFEPNLRRIFTPKNIIKEE